jgi:hypothetical protein
MSSNEEGLGSKANGKKPRNKKKASGKQPKGSSSSVPHKERKEKDRKKETRVESKQPSHQQLASLSFYTQEHDLTGTGKSFSADFKYFRNESLSQIIREKSKCSISKQALTFLAAGMEFVASEIISESLLNSLNNRIVPKAIFRTIEDDPDLNDLFNKGIVLSSMPIIEGQKFKVTGYQVD